MFNCTRIKGVEYYYKMGADAAQGAGLSPHEVDSEGTRRDYVDYLGDNGAGEAPGRWLLLSPAGTELAASPGIFARCKDGQQANGRVLRDLASGKDPETGEIAIQRKRLRKGQAPVDPGGYDLQISLPKSLSLLKVFGPEGDNRYRQKITDFEADSYRKTMQWAADLGLLATRIDGKYVPAAQIVMATFAHSTSRAEDPQSHTHGALMKMCVRPDGQLGMLDNFLLKRYGGAIAAYHRAEVAKQIRGLGLAVERDGRNFQIAGFPPKILELFSKRRQEIEKLAREKGFNTAEARMAAQVASFETRADKAFTPLAELEERWDRELATAGWSRETIMNSLEVAARLAEHIEETEDERRVRLNGLVMKALDQVMQTNAVFTRATLYREALEALQTEAGGDEAMDVVTTLERSGVLVRVAEMEGEEPIYTTAEMMELEKAILRTAYDRRNERPFFDPAHIDRFIARFPTITEEQAKAVQHAMNRDGVAIVQGFAGTGKSFATAVTKQAAEDAGYEVWGIAPSWKATDVLRKDAGLADDHAMALAKFLYGIRSGKIELSEKTVLILDEAGMVGHADMRKLMDIAAEVGAKLILQGDVMQYRAVAAGAPMAAMQRLIGSAKLSDIQRQKGRTKAEERWMRAASKDLATGQPQAIKRALERYDQEGRIAWAEDDDQAVAQLAELYMADRLAAPDKTRAITAQWNADARKISEVLRARMRDAGLLSREGIEVAIIPRGARAESKPVKIELSAGDEVIFGENVLVSGVMIRNADLGRVEQIAGDQENPVLTVRLAKGETVTARLNEFVGRRAEPEEGEEPVQHAPMFQHAYALTGHAMQGVTVDRHFDIVLQSRGAAGTYVCATRHREDFHMIVSCERLADKLAAEAPATMTMARGRMRTPEEGDKDSAGPELDEVKRAYFNEACGADPLGNVTDHLKTPEALHEFIGVQPPAKPQVENQVAPEMAEALKPAYQRRPPPPRRIPAGAIIVSQPPAAPPTPAEELKARMEARKTAPAGYQTRRITQEEMDTFVRTNLIDAARDMLGGKVVETWNGGEAAMLTFGENGDKVAITKKNIWTWTVANGAEKGVIWDLVAKVQGLTKMQAMHWLRDRLKTWTPSLRPAPQPQEARPAAGSPAALAEVRRYWQRFKDHPSEWALNRQLEKETLAAVRADMRAESTHEKAGNRYGVAFAHRNEAGEIVSYARRGASFHGFAGGGTPTLWRAGEHERPVQILVTESAIDTLSKWQLDGRPAGVLLASTDGTPGAGALELVKALARKHPNVIWQISMDNDEEGERHALRIVAAIREVNPHARIEDARPTPAFKDWNDALRGRTRELIAKEKLEAERRKEAEERARLEAEQNHPRMR